MVSDARKTDAQRFGNGKKGFSVKQVKDILSEIPTTEEMETALETKQDVLTAGDNITIVDDVISAIGGASEWEFYSTAGNFKTNLTEKESESNDYFAKKDILFFYSIPNATFGATTKGFCVGYIPKNSYIIRSGEYLNYKPICCVKYIADNNIAYNVINHDVPITWLSNDTFSTVNARFIVIDFNNANGTFLCGTNQQTIFAQSTTPINNNSLSETNKLWIYTR